MARTRKSGEWAALNEKFGQPGDGPAKAEPAQAGADGGAPDRSRPARERPQARRAPAKRAVRAAAPAPDEATGQPPEMPGGKAAPPTPIAGEDVALDSLLATEGAAVGVAAHPISGPVGATATGTGTATVDAAAEADEAALAQIDASGELAELDELAEQMIGGFNVAAPRRRSTGDPRLAELLRRFARSATWALPAAAVCIGLISTWGWPGPVPASGSPAPAAWLVVTLLGLCLSLIGVSAMTLLLCVTAGRYLAIGAFMLMLAGVTALGAVAGVVGLARPAVVSAASPAAGKAGQIGAKQATLLYRGLFDSATGRWLLVGGLALLALAWLLMALAILSSRVLNQMDGFLVIISVGLAAASSYLKLDFLLVIAAMTLLAAGLGLSWSASRLTADGLLRED